MGVAVRRGVASGPAADVQPPSREFAPLFNRYAKRRLGTLDFAWAFEDFLPECRRVAASIGAHSVCDVGGGRRPLLGLEEIERDGIDYTVLDISSDELAHTPAGYSSICADVCSPPPELSGRFDLVFSMFLAEHVRDGEALHRSVFSMLRPGGVALHVFPTLYYPAFAANKLLPEPVTRMMVRALVNHPRKFPARYSWCFGPTRTMHERLSALGYEVMEYRPFYGTYYLQRVPGVRIVEERFSAWAAASRNPHLTSFARVQLRKPPAR